MPEESGLITHSDCQQKEQRGLKLIEIVRNPHAEGQFNHVKGLKRD